MKEMKTLTINGQTYEIVDQTARNAIPSVDTILTKSGAAADAKVVGEKFTKLEQAIEDVNNGTSDNVLADKIDFTYWADGEFTVTVDGVAQDGSVTFDSNNRPKRVTLNGHTMTLVFPEVE